MTTWTITNRATDVCLGTYEGETVEEAWEACARDAGYEPGDALAVRGDDITVERRLRIDVTTSEDVESLGAGATPEDVSRWAAFLLERLQETYPDAEVNVDVAGDRTHVRVWNDGIGEEGLREAVLADCQDIFDAWCAEGSP